MDLLFSGRIMLGTEAAELGLANRALPADRVLDEAIAYARELATFSSPASMAAMKKQVYADLERGLSAATDEANELMLESFQRPDFVEGVAELRRKAGAGLPARYERASARVTASASVAACSTVV